MPRALGQHLGDIEEEIKRRKAAFEKQYGRLYEVTRQWCWPSGKPALKVYFGGDGLEKLIFTTFTESHWPDAQKHVQSVRKDSVIDDDEYESDFLEELASDA